MDEKLLSRLKLLATPNVKDLDARLAHWVDNNEGITDAMNAQLTEEETQAFANTVAKLAIGAALGSLRNAAKELNNPGEALGMLANLAGIMEGVRKHDGFEIVATNAFLIGFNLAYIDAPIPDAVPEKETKPEAQPETQA